MRVARRQVRYLALVILGVRPRTKEAALDQRQEGSVVGHSVRHIVRFREGGDGDQGDADTQLIKGGTLGWEPSNGTETGTELGLNPLALGTVQPFARLLADGIGALPRRNPIRGTRPALGGGWRRDVVIKTSVLVMGDEENGVAPVRTLAYRIDELSDEALTCA